MKTQHTLKKRANVDSHHTWDLSDLIRDSDQWQLFYDDIKTLTTALNAYQGKLNTSADTLYACLAERELIDEKFSRLYAYSHMHSHENTTLDLAQEAVEKVSALQVTVMSAKAFIEPELLLIKETILRSMIADYEPLGLYQHYIDNLLRQKAHILPKEQELLLAMLSDFADSPTKIFSMFNNADLKFPDIINEYGKLSPLTKGNFVKYLENPNKKVRKTAFKTLYSVYKKYNNTLASIFTSQLKKDVFIMRARQFDSTCEASLFENNIDVTVYDQLIETVNNHLDLLHRYVRLRKKLLKLDELHIYDLYTPMIAEATEPIDYEAAKSTVLKALQVMGPDYTDTVQKAFDNRWIDVYENEGKRSGAYSWGTYGTHPYILLNHQDNINHMFTLAHELGHTMHSYYSSESQSSLYSSYPIFLAEVASTVNESLLMQYLLKTTTDKKKRLYLLNHYMESFRTTLYRQVMFAEYEKLTHELTEQGEALTADRLSSLYYDLNKKYYGDELIIDEEISMEWARIPHFYYNYYVFQYATGFASAVAIAQGILDHGETSVNNFKVFLSSGSSRYALDTLKSAGVDMTTSKPVEHALSVFATILDEMEQLVD